MPRLSLGLGAQNVCKIKSGGAAPITTSKAFNSSNVQVGSTNTGDIPANWVANEATVTSVTFANDNSVTSIGSYAFAYTALASVTIPSSVTSIGSNAFYYCASLTSITIPNSVLTIGSSAFFGCASLATATIGNSVTSIGAGAFKGCNGLTTLTIGNSVTSIGASAFEGCNGLTTITIPNSVLTIGGNAFDDCTSLASITIPNSVTSIGNYAFGGCNILASVTCRVAQSAFTGSNAFYQTASPLVIQARITDASWTAGVGLTFQGNTNVTVIKNL